MGTISGFKNIDNGALGPIFYNLNGIWEQALIFGSLEP